MTIRRQKDVSFKKSKILEEFKKKKAQVESKNSYLQGELSKGFSVLLIDKSVINGKQLSTILKDELKQCRIYVCQSEFTALKVLKMNNIDMIVSEINLQNYNGLDFAMSVRILMKKEYPFVFYSESSCEDYRFVLSQMDRSSFLERPFEKNILSETLKDIFKGQKLVA